MPVISETKEFEDVTLYLAGMFGVGRTDCRTLKITTGVEYAQYDDAIRVEYLEKGKRKGRRLILDYKPWLRVVNRATAINPANPLVANADGSRVSRYTSFDPRYITDFEDLLANSGTPVILAIGEGEREKCARCHDRIATTEEGGAHVCGICAAAIRGEAEFDPTATEVL